MFRICIKQGWCGVVWCGVVWCGVVWCGVEYGCCKSGKSSGEEGLNSDHLINAPHRLIVILCQIFNIMIVHGMCSKSKLIGTMIPIPKVKYQVVCKSDNFRAIALSSIFGKVLDWIILIKEQKSLCISNLQFGFKVGISTTQGTYVVNETISY